MTNWFFLRSAAADILQNSFKDLNLILFDNIYSSRPNADILVIDYESALRSLIQQVGIGTIRGLYQEKLDADKLEEKDKWAIIYEGILTQLQQISEGQSALVMQSAKHPYFSKHVPGIIQKLRIQTQKYRA